MPTKVEIEAEIGRRLNDCKSIRDEAVKSHGGMIPGDQMTTVNEHISQIKSLRDQLKAQTDIDSFLSGGATQVNDPGKDDEKAREGYDEQGRMVWDGSKKLSEMVTESKQYKAMLARHARGGHISKDAQVSMERLNFAPKKRGQKDMVITGASATSAGSLVFPQFEGLTPYWSSYQRPLMVRGLFTGATTETDTIQYARITSVTNNAAARAEATSEAAPVLPATFSAGGALVNNAGGGYAAESGMVFERDTVNVQDFAHWIPVTKRALADAGQIQAQIDIFLGYGLEATLETEFLTGSGSSPHLAGINSTSGIQTFDQATLSGGSGYAFISTRKARTLVRVNAHCDPTAYLMHPSDWEGIDLQRAGVYNGSGVVGAGGFLGAGPFEMSQPRLWGLPVVLSEAVATGTCWVAAWNRGVVFDRQQTSLQMTDQHADYFVRGLVAILAEERLAFAVLHPQAFLKITNFVATA